MRLVIPFALWLGALHQVGAPEQLAPDGALGLLTTAGALAGLTVMVYRLGVWRQEMENTKHNVGAEVARYREESKLHFARLERRFDSIDRHFAALNQRVDHLEQFQGAQHTEVP